MKSIKNRFCGFLICLSVSFGTISLHAKLYVPKTDEQFYRELSRHNLAVVHFNPYPVESTEFKLQRMKDAFTMLAKMDRFKDADVAFFGVNLQVISELADDFDIDMPVIVPADDDDLGDEDLDDDDDIDDDEMDDEDDEPQEIKKEDASKDAQGDVEEKDISEITPEEQATLILFRGGKPLKEDGKIIKRTGFLTKIEMQDFINKYFGAEIDRILTQKKQQERERLQARYVQQPKRRLVQRVYYTDDYDYAPGYRGYGYYPGPTWRRWGYYGYPYGYWPGFGMGFGFGGRRGGFSFGFGW